MHHHIRKVQTNIWYQPLYCFSVVFSPSPGQETLFWNPKLYHTWVFVVVIVLVWFVCYFCFCLFVLVGVELYQQNSRKLMQIMQSDVILLISWATCQIKHRLFFLKNLYTSFWLTFKCSFLSFWGISMFCLRTSQKFNKAPGGSPLLL